MSTGQHKRPLPPFCAPNTQPSERPVPPAHQATRMIILASVHARPPGDHPVISPSSPKSYDETVPADAYAAKTFKRFLVYFFFRSTLFLCGLNS
jgi:hypothetical protein